MATYYVDYEGSAGTGDGSSFANRAFKVKDLTLSAGDEVRIKKTPDPTSLGTGHVKRAPGHPDFSTTYKSGSNITYSSTDGETKLTSMGNGWLTGDIIHIYHNDSTTGKSISGLWRVTVESGTETNASLKLDNFPGPSDTTASSTAFRWHACTNAIYLNTDNLTKSIACRDAYRDSWTATGTGVTTSYSHASSTSAWQQGHDYVVFTGSDSFSIGSSASNGKLAYYELPSTLDLSGYQQVSFMFRSNQTTNGNSNKFSLRLCTDTAGNTSVHTIPIDYKNQKSNTWIGLNVDLGTNLNSSIKSVALYQDSTPSGSTTMLLQNIIACKASSAADSITLNKLVGLNTSDDTTWYPLQFIWDNILFLKTQSRGRPSFGYYGSNGAAFSATNTNATIYQRAQVKPYDSNVNQSDYTPWDNNNNSGTEASPITISGGWDETSMSTRNGKTCIEFNGSMYPLDPTGSHVQLSHIYLTNFGRVSQNIGRYRKWSNFGVSHFDAGFSFGSGNKDVQGLGLDFIIGVTSATNAAIQLNNGSTFSDSQSDFYIKQAVGPHHTGQLIYALTGAGSSSWDLLNVVACGSQPIRINSNVTVNINTLKWGYNAGTGNVPTATGGTINCDRLDAIQPYYQAAKSSGTFIISDLNITTDTTFGTTYKRYGAQRSLSFSLWVDGASLMKVIDTGTLPAQVYLVGGVMQLKGTVNSFYASLTQGGVLESIDHEGVSGANKAFFEGGNIVAEETTTRHTASGVAWKCTGGSSCAFSLGKIVVSANSAVTVGLWTYKNHADNAIVKLKIPADPMKGLSEQTVDNLSASVNTWTKIEKTFTPTRAGIIEIQVEFKNLTSSQFTIIDDLEVSQA